MTPRFPFFPFRRFAALLAAGAALGLHGAAAAQGFPSRTIVIVAPVPPGGPLDLFARLYGDELQKRLNRPVVIENRTGAGGLIGAEYVTRAAADGHTLLLSNDSVLATPNFVNSKFDGTRDLTALAMVTNAAHGLFTSTQLSVKTIAELLAYGKANPGKLNVAYLPQSLLHLNTLRFMKITGLEVNLVPCSCPPPTQEDAKHAPRIT